MTVKLLENEKDCILVLEGRLDTNASPEVEKILDSVSERFYYVTLDIAKLEYISSSGLRLILKLHLALSRKSGELTIKNAGSQVMEVFEMVGFTTFCRFI